MPVVTRWVKGTGRAGSLTYASKALATSPPGGGSNDKRPPGWKYNVLDTAFVGGPGRLLAPFAGAGLEDVGLRQRDVGLSLEEAPPEG